MYQELESHRLNNANKTKKYTINHRKAVKEMKKFRQNLKRKGLHVVKCVTKSNIVAQLNKIWLN